MDYSKLSVDELDDAIKLAEKYKLDGDRLPIALKVQRESIRQGVNPDFVLPMVMAESGFNPKASSDKGAIGVMQLMPDTAKGLKVDANDVDQNISGGIKLIKELMADKKIGNDPYKVLAGYNASTETRQKFFETGDLNVLPTETINHMLKVSDYYGGHLPEVSYVAPKSEEPKAEQVVEPKNPEAARMAAEDSSMDDLSMGQQAAIMAPIGGVTGVAIGSAKKPIVDFGRYAYNAVLNPEHTPEPVAPPAPEATSMPIRRPVNAPTGDLTATDKQVLGTGDKTAMTGRESQTGYAETTAQRAARKDVQQQVAEKAGLAPKRTFAEFPDVGSTKGGLLASKKTLDDIEMHNQALRESYRQRALAKAQAAGGQWQKLQAQLEAEALAKAAHEAKWSTRAKNAMGAATRGFRTSLPGTLGAMGFGAGAMTPLAVSEYQQGNNAGAMGALGTGAGLGYAAARAPKVMGPLGAASLAAYQLTHPKEVSADIRYHDINPTAFMGMPEQGEYAFPDQR